MNNLKKLAFGTTFNTVIQSELTNHFLSPGFALRASAGRLSIIKTHPLVKSKTYESFSYRQEGGFPA